MATEEEVIDKALITKKWVMAAVGEARLLLILEARDNVFYRHLI